MSFLRALFTAAARPVPPAGPPVDAELTAAAAALLRSIRCHAVADQVQVSWNSRLSSSAGLAYPASYRISLNPRLKAFPAEVDRTLRHELAHLVASSRARRSRIAAHGVEWRQACVDLGIAGEDRCHALPLPRRKHKRGYVYRCPCCGLLLRRTRRVNLRRRPLACRACCREHSGGRFDVRFQFVELREFAVPDLAKDVDKD